VNVKNLKVRKCGVLTLRFLRGHGFKRVGAGLTIIISCFTRMRLNPPRLIDILIVEAGGWEDFKLQYFFLTKHFHNQT
jgi:hypothetical protein